MTHPTIKLLEEALVTIELEAEAHAAFETADTKSYEIVVIALRTLIEKHEDVEKLKALTCNHVFQGGMSAKRNKFTEQCVRTAVNYILDTIINEITKRIEDGENNF